MAPSCHFFDDLFFTLCLSQFQLFFWNDASPEKETIETYLLGLEDIVFIDFEEGFCMVRVIPPLAAPLS